MGHPTFNQRTVATAVSCHGVGLHSGAPVKLTLRPAPVGHGILFVRTDTPSQVTIPAKSAFVVDTALATSLGRDGVKVSTVEHLLAAITGVGVDNVRVELDGPEVPIMDGSSAAFVALIREAGVREQQAPKQLLVVKRAVTVRDGDKYATLAPARAFRVDCTIDFKHPLISDQSFEMEFSDVQFAKEISRARTFGFLRDVERLKTLGLARGGSLENAIVVDEFSILNPEGLRFPDEFVRHKVLDAVGDVALFGHPVIGHLTAYKGGHALHHKLVQAVLADEANYQVVSAGRGELERLQLRVPDFSAILEPLVA